MSKPELTVEEKEKLPCGMCGVIRKNHALFTIPISLDNNCNNWVPPMFCSQECCPGSCECEDCGGCD